MQRICSTMQIPIILGAGIEERHIALPNVAVVNEEFVKKFFAEKTPLAAGSRSVLPSET